MSFVRLGGHKKKKKKTKMQIDNDMVRDHSNIILIQTFGLINVPVKRKFMAPPL